MENSGDIVVVKELRERNDAELRSLLSSKREDLHQASFKHQLGQLRETHRIKELRKDIARLNTVLRERTEDGRGQES